MKLFHKIAVAFVGASMAIGVGAVAARNSRDIVPAHADEVYKTALFGSSNNSAGNQNYTSSFTATNDNFTVSLQNFNNNNNGWSGTVKCGPKKASGQTQNVSTATVSTTAAIDKPITKVVVTVGSYLTTSSSSATTKLEVSSSSDFSNATEVSVTMATGELTYTVASPAASKYYRVSFTCTNKSTTNGMVGISKIQYYYSPSTAVYSVTNSVENGSIGEISSVEKNAALNLTITPNSHYSLPNTISVTIGGNAYNGFSYNNSTGAFSIAAGVIDGNVVISGTCVEDTKYNITYVAGSNGSGSNYVVSEYAGETHSLVSFATTGLEADDGYRFKCYSIGGDERDPGYSFTVDSAVTVTVLFEVMPLEAEYVFTDKDLAYTTNSYGGTWSANPSANAFETSSPSRGVQFGSAVGEGTLSLDISGVNTFDNYVFTSVTLTASTNGTAAANTLSVSVGSTAFKVDSSETYSMPKENNYQIVFKGYADAGNVTITFNDTNKSIYFKSISIQLAEAKEITGSRINPGTVSASTGDSEWTLNGFSFEVQYDDDPSWVPVEATYVVSADVPEIYASGTLDVTVTGTFGTATKTSETIHATLTYVNLYTIAQLYADGATNKDYVVDGVYMGEVSNGYIFMNGEFGILDYDSTHSKTLTLGESYTLSGTRDVYSGLIEIKNTTATAISNPTRKGNIATPVVYEVIGGETANKANRKTSLTGVVEAISSTTAGQESTVTVDIGAEDSITVYIKSGVSTQKMIDALVDSKNKTQEVTIEGFTSWHNGFEVSLTDVVVADENYTQFDFARSLLKLTKGVCNSSYDGVTSNKSALVTIWSTLSGAEYYGKLAGEHLSAVVSGTANKNIVVPATDDEIDAMSDADALAAALYRYDYCTAKYELTEFIVGRTLSVSFSRQNIIGFVANDSNSAAVVITIVSTVSLAAIAAYFLLKKKHA